MADVHVSACVFTGHSLFFFLALAPHLFYVEVCSKGVALRVANPAFFIQRTPRAVGVKLN